MVFYRFPASFLSLPSAFPEGSQTFRPFPPSPIKAVLQKTRCRFTMEEIGR